MPYGKRRKIAKKGNYPKAGKKYTGRGTAKTPARDKKASVKGMKRKY